MKKLTVCILVMLLLSVLLAGNVSADGGKTVLTDVLADAVEYDGNYYMLIKSECTWQQAKLYCEGLGGHLATPTSAEEDAFCHQLYKAAGYGRTCWLGASDLDLEGRWEWVTEEPWSYDNWASGEPNGGTGENCLNYYTGFPNGEWNDGPENEKALFICEWEEEDIARVRSAYGYLGSADVIYNNAFYYNGNVYKLFDYRMSAAEAKEYCERLGGHLATVTTAEEDAAMFSYLVKMGRFDCTFGGNDERAEGVWEWVTGEEFSYTNWGSGEPNNQGDEDFVEITASGVWNDAPWQPSFMCEWDNCCVLADGTVTEHQFGAETEVEPPSCEKTGTAEKVCSGCGAVVTVRLEKLPHNYKPWETVTPASCHAGGEETRACFDCDAVETRALDPLTHAWSEWTATTPATCHHAGKEERQCGLCRDTETRDVDALTHQFGEYTVVRGNKLIPPIVSEKTCTLCGEVEREEDWSNIWITVLAVVAMLGIGVGVVNYIRAFRNK